MEKETILIKINACLSTDFEIKKINYNMRKYIYIYIYTSAQKLTRDTISICTPLPLGAFRKDGNVSSVNELNMQLCCLKSKAKHLALTKINLIDLNAEFQNKLDYIYTDGFHASENGVKASGKSLRSNQINLNFEISNCAISI